MASSHAPGGSSSGIASIRSTKVGNRLGIPSLFLGRDRDDVTRYGVVARHWTTKRDARLIVNAGFLNGVLVGLLIVHILFLAPFARDQGDARIIRRSAWTRKLRRSGQVVRTPETVGFLGSRTHGLIGSRGNRCFEIQHA